MGAAPPATATHGPLRLARLDEAAARALLASLRAAREGLLARPAVERARMLGRAGARFLDPGDPLRREAEALVPEEAGLSHAMARAVIDGMARDWTEPRLCALLGAELGDPGVLDALVSAPMGGRLRAFG